MRYYDLGRAAPACPKCGAAFVEAARAYPTRRARRVPPVSVVPVEVEPPVAIEPDENDEVQEADDADQDEESVETEPEAEEPVE